MLFRSYVRGTYHLTATVVPSLIHVQIGTPNSAELPVRNNGFYDPFPYKFIGYPKVARNIFELSNGRAAHGSQPNPVAERVLRPRYLCFLREPGTPALIMAVDDWIAQNKTESNLSYVFVAYTTEQFSTPDDLLALHQIADAAARNAGVGAYWIGCSCMPEENNLEDDASTIIGFIDTFTNI